MSQKGRPRDDKNEPSPGMSRGGAGTSQKSPEPPKSPQPTKESKTTKESTSSKSPKEQKPPTSPNPPKESKPPKSPKPPKEPKPPKPPKEPKPPKPPKEPKPPKSPKPPKEPKPPKPPKEPKPPKPPKEPKPPKPPKEPKPPKPPKEPKPPKPPKEPKPPKSPKASKRKRENVGGLDNLKSEIDLDEHIISLPQLYKRYNTDPEQGLTEAYAQQVLQKEGLNILTPGKSTPQWVIFCYHMFSGFAMILWVGAALCGIAYLIEVNTSDDVNPDHLYLGAIMLVVVVISGTFSYAQDRSSSKIMESFKKMVSHQATVIREGKVKNIPAEHLVRGEIVLVKFGNKVPADIRIIESFGMKVDNSSLTGETEPQPRSPEKTSDNPMETQNLAFFSTNVMEGTCKGIVFQVGDKTVIGRLAKLTVGLKRDTSPLKKEIKHFVRIITCVAFAFSFAFLIAGLVTGFSVIQSFIYFLAILIANVPEGLLVTVTLCLTLTAKKMAKKNCLIKSLDSVETLGSTSTICSDKTGTLTQNRMTVMEIIYNFKAYEVKYGLDRSSTVDNEFDKNNPDFKNLVRCAQLCLRAEFEGTDDELPVLNRVVEGDASEAAILKCVECMLHNVKAYRVKNPKIMEVPFNSTNKYQLSIHRLETGKNLLVMKGAPEKILELCSTISIGGEAESFTPQRKAEMNKVLLNLGRKGERVLGFCDAALNDPPGTEYSLEKKNFPTNNLRFVGLMALIDPPRETVPDAVRKCKTAGIRVIMVTGDHPVTAEAIARKVGIMSNETKKDLAERLQIPEDKVPQNMVKAIVVPGDQLRVMSKAELDQVLLNHTEIVFARTTPTQKLFIVEGCQRLGFITAVTGDGVNDSPALKKADIGIAMGITGSDVSKQAADMILLDDNFSSIVTGVEEGRIIFDNLKKSITYLLTSNVPEMAPFMAFIILKVPMPLSIMAVLIVDIGTDMVPAIALAYEKAESDIMLRRPRNPFYDKLVNRRLIWMAYGQIGILQTVAGFCSYFVVYAQFGFLPMHLIGIRDDWENNALSTVIDSYGQEWTYESRKDLECYAQSAFFAAIIVTQIADAVICKTRRNSIFHQGMTNWVLNGGLIFAVGLGCLLLYTPGIQSFILLPPLRLVHWLPGVPFAIAIFVFDEIRRLIIRKRPGGWVERETYY